MVNELKQLEKKIAFQYFEDGFWDMYLGLMALSFGLAILFDVSYLAGITVTIGFLLHRLGKSKITYPRIGYIKLKKARKKAIVSILSGVFVFGLMMFFLLVLGMDNAVTVFLKENMLLVIAVIWGGAIALSGLSFDIKRYYFYAVLVFSSVYISEWVGDLGLNLLIVGILIILSGAIVMLQFVRKYPLVLSEDK